MSHPGRNRRWMTAALTVLLLAVPTLPAQIALVASQASELPPNITSGMPEGLTLSPLAVADMELLPESSDELQSQGLELNLERIPVNWGEVIDGRDAEAGDLPPGFVGDQAASGTHLLFVESGEITITTGQGTAVYTAGMSLVLPEDTPYSVQNTALECASLLRMSAALIAGGAGVGSETPSTALPVCGDPTLLVSISAPPVLGMMQLLLLHATWDTGQLASPVPAFSAAHPGPAGYWIESGTVRMSDANIYTQSLITHAAGQTGIAIPAYSGYRAMTFRPERITWLIMAALPAGAQFWMPPPLWRSSYVTLLHHDSWQVTGESWDSKDQYSSVQLSNGVSSVALEEFIGYEGDPRACIDDAVAQLMSDPAVSNLQPLAENGSSASLGRQIDPSAESAQFTYTLMHPDGTTQELAKYMQCSNPGAGSIMLRISAILPVSDLDAQLVLIDELLQGLVVFNS